MKQCLKNEQQCFIGFKITRRSLVSLDQACPSGVRTKGSKCEGKVLAFKKNKPGVISILYIKNANEECFIGFKARARDILSMF